MFFNTHRDKELIRQLWAGRKPVMQWVRKNSGSREDAEDIVQEAIMVCMKIMEKPDFRQVAKAETLLFAVAKKMWLYQLRKNKRMPATELGETEWTADMEGMEAMIEREDQLQILEHALRDLGQKCRQLLEMFYFLKMDMRAIAEKLEFRNDKVAKAMKYKCLEQARQMIKQQSK